MIAPRRAITDHAAVKDGRAGRNSTRHPLILDPALSAPTTRRRSRWPRSSAWPTRRGAWGRQPPRSTSRPGWPRRDGPPWWSTSIPSATRPAAWASRRRRAIPWSPANRWPTRSSRPRSRGCSCCRARRAWPTPTRCRPPTASGPRRCASSSPASSAASTTSSSTAPPHSAS